MISKISIFLLYSEQEIMVFTVLNSLEFTVKITLSTLVQTTDDIIYKSFVFCGTGTASASWAINWYDNNSSTAWHLLLIEAFHWNFFVIVPLDFVVLREVKARYFFNTLFIVYYTCYNFVVSITEITYSTGYYQV